MYHNLGIVKWSAVHAWNIHVMRALNSYLFGQNFYSIKPSPAIHDVYMCVFEVNGVKSFKDFSSPSKNAKTTVIYFNSFLKSIIQTKCYYWSEINIPAIQLRKYYEIVNAPFNTGNYVIIFCWSFKVHSQVRSREVLHETFLSFQCNIISTLV